MEWKPIETAPQDGTWILLIKKKPDGGFYVPIVAKWHRSQWDDEGDLSEEWEPDFWTPLPENPTP